MKNNAVRHSQSLRKGLHGYEIGTAACNLEQQRNIAAELLPGDGEFPLREFVNALPPGVPIGVEVPMQSLKDRGVGPMERARLAVEAARRVIAQARATSPGAR